MPLEDKSQVIKVHGEEKGKSGHDYSYLGLRSAKSPSYGWKWAYLRDNKKQLPLCLASPKGQEAVVQISSNSETHQASSVCF